MKVMLEIEDKKAPALLRVLKDLKYVKAKKIKKKITQEEFLKGLKESVDEVNLAIRGKAKMKTFDEFLNEL